MFPITLFTIFVVVPVCLLFYRLARGKQLEEVKSLPNPTDGPYKIYVDLDTFIIDDKPSRSYSQRIYSHENVYVNTSTENSIDFSFNIYDDLMSFIDSIEDLDLPEDSPIRTLLLFGKEDVFNIYLNEVLTFPSLSGDNSHLLNTIVSDGKTYQMSLDFTEPDNDTSLEGLLGTYHSFTIMVSEVEKLAPSDKYIHGVRYSDILLLVFNIKVIKPKTSGMIQRIFPLRLNTNA